jgi:hypothetical protein
MLLHLAKAAGFPGGHAHDQEPLVCLVKKNHQATGSGIVQSSLASLALYCTLFKVQLFCPG